MDIYHVWCDLKPGVKDIEFTDAANQFFDRMMVDGALASYRITRRKLGLGGEGLGDFHLMLEFDNLAQLDEAFNSAAARTDPVESFHHAVNSRVTNVRFALYRDFPDRVRESGEEKF